MHNWLYFSVPGQWDRFVSWSIRKHGVDFYCCWYGVDTTINKPHTMFLFVMIGKVRGWGCWERQQQNEEQIRETEREIKRVSVCEKKCLKGERENKERGSKLEETEKRERSHSYITWMDWGNKEKWEHRLLWACTELDWLSVAFVFCYDLNTTKRFTLRQNFIDTELNSFQKCIINVVATLIQRMILQPQGHCKVWFESKQEKNNSPLREITSAQKWETGCIRLIPGIVLWKKDVNRSWKKHKGKQIDNAHWKQ